jgi:hypothetical protein
MLFKEFEPATDRIVVQQKRIGDFLTAPPIVQKHQGVCASRHARDRRPIARQRDQLVSIFFAEKAASNHTNIGIRQTRKFKEFLPRLQRVGVYQAGTSSVCGQDESITSPTDSAWHRAARL